MKIALTLGAAALGFALLGVVAPASALPMDHGVTSPNAIEHVAAGCGRGWTRSRYGRCVPAFHGPRYSAPHRGTRTTVYRNRIENCDMVPNPRGRGMIRRCR